MPRWSNVLAFWKHGTQNFDAHSKEGLCFLLLNAGRVVLIGYGGSNTVWLLMLVIKDDVVYALLGETLALENLSLCVRNPNTLRQTYCEEVKPPREGTNRNFSLQF